MRHRTKIKYIPVAQREDEWKYIKVMLIIIFHLFMMMGGAWFYTENTYHTGLWYIGGFMLGWGMLVCFLSTMVLFYYLITANLGE